MHAFNFQQQYNCCHIGDELWWLQSRVELEFSAKTTCFQNALDLFASLQLSMFNDH